MNHILNSLILKGNVADKLRQKQFSGISVVLVLLIGTIYGIYLYYIDDIFNGGSLILFFYILIGYFNMVASQFGIALTVWSISRIFKAKSSLIVMYIAVGFVMVPFGLMTILIKPNVNLLNIPIRFGMASICLALVFFYLTRIIQSLEGFSNKKSIVCVTISYVFVISFKYLLH